MKGLSNDEEVRGAVGGVNVCEGAGGDGDLNRTVFGEFVDDGLLEASSHALGRLEAFDAFDLVGQSE